MAILMKALPNKASSLLPTAFHFMRNLRHIIYAIALSVILGGCTTTPSFKISNQTWKLYKNARYGFEFPYPSTWKSVPSDNGDGIVFISPRNNTVEIRSWAGMQLPEGITSEKNQKHR
ncbi:hypothetical protein NIES4106_20730 [Fischerella sp. NIES-4106]|nr:hypothetical protein NIES4106_20730 [Fischerella sp. NIES-4106]